MLHARIGTLTAGYQDDNSRHAKRYPYDVSHGPLFERASNALAWRLAFLELIGHDISGFGDGSMERIVPEGYDYATGVVCFKTKPEGWYDDVEKVIAWTVEDTEAGTLKRRRIVSTDLCFEAAETDLRPY